MKYKTCEKCGQNLDYGEKCDCEKETVISFENLLGELDTPEQYTERLSRLS